MLFSSLNPLPTLHFAPAIHPPAPRHPSHRHSPCPTYASEWLLDSGARIERIVEILHLARQGRVEPSDLVLVLTFDLGLIAREEFEQAGEIYARARE